MKTNAARRAAWLVALGLAGCGGESRMHDRPGTGGDETSTGGDGTSAGGSTSTGGDGTTAGGSTTSGGTGTSPGGSGASGGTGGTPQNPFPCVDPTDNGNLEGCAGGLMHRKAADACTSRLPRPDAVTDAPDAPCTHDADCTAFPNGYCTSYRATGQLRFTCNYGCVADSDCGAGHVCLCGDVIGTCAKADCVTDADCAAGFLCAESDESYGCRQTAFTCQMPSDTCASDVDCPAARPVCSVGTSHGARTCVSKGCVID